MEQRSASKARRLSCGLNTFWVKVGGAAILLCGVGVYGWCSWRQIAFDSQRWKEAGRSRDYSIRWQMKDDVVRLLSGMKGLDVAQTLRLLGDPDISNLGRRQKVLPGSPGPAIDLEYEIGNPPFELFKIDPWFLYLAFNAQGTELRSIRVAGS